MLFIIKFFPEIVMKSKPVRRQMSRRLCENLLTQLRPLDSRVKVISDWDRLTVRMTETSPAIVDGVVAILSQTSGIAHFLEVETIDFSTLEEVYEKTLAVYREKLANKRFVVRCKRSGKHDYTSTEIERLVGGYLLQHSDSTGVDLHDPEVTVNIEIKDQTLYVVTRRIAGLGGFPLGEVEPVLSLISGGFDSPVASFLTMKRGMPTHFCFFNLGGREHELGVKEVSYYLWQKFGAGRRVKFISVPFEPVVAEILQNVENSQMGVILKRMMLRVATRLAENLEVQALVTGEAVSQVSSQTLANLSVINSVTDMLVLRPLITTDKEDIISIARKIGTAEFAENMPEYCGVISVKPTTRARAYRVEKEEANFNFEILEQAFASAQIVNIDELAHKDHVPVDVEILEVPLPDSVIIDIRHHDQQELRPLVLPGQVVEHIPFYSLHTRFPGLPEGKRYLLYCDKGVMSRLHAAHLAGDGYRVAVYRPQQ